MFKPKAPPKAPRQSVQQSVSSAMLQSAPPINVTDERLLSLYIMPDDPAADQAAAASQRKSLASRSLSAASSALAKRRSSRKRAGSAASAAGDGQTELLIEEFLARVEARQRPEVQTISSEVRARARAATASPRRRDGV